MAIAERLQKATRGIERHYLGGADSPHAGQLEDNQIPSNIARDSEVAAAVTSAVGAHEADTTDVHGIADTSVLATDDDVAAAVAAIEAFPVGSVFISVVSTNPATLLGYGTWIAFGAGRTLVGLDGGDTDFDTVEETGGAKTHTLTTAEMPAHTHDIQVATAAASGTNRQHPSGAPTGTFATDPAGGDGAHNNVQPYIVTYFWKRTA